MNIEYEFNLMNHFIPKPKKKDWMPFQKSSLKTTVIPTSIYPFVVCELSRFTTTTLWGLNVTNLTLII
jgi:hypothetical protein